MKSNYDLWWRGMYAPSHLIDDIIDKIENNKSVLLTNKKEIPWKNKLIKECYSRVQEELGFLVDKIDTDNINDDETILNYIFKKLGIGSKYKSDKVSLNELSLLDGDKKRVIIIDCNDNNRSEQVINIVNKLSKQNKTILLSLIEDYDYNGGYKINYDDYITSFDRLNLLKIICHNNNYNKVINNYISELGNRLYPNNLEEACDFVQDYKLCVNQINEENQMQYWQAQLEIFYPLIEEKKQKLIEKYYDCLKNNTPYVDKFDNQINIPEEFELSHLRILNNERVISFNQKDYDLLIYLYEFRNKLAHMKCVDERILLDEKLK